MFKERLSKEVYQVLQDGISFVEAYSLQFKNEVGVVALLWGIIASPEDVPIFDRKQIRLTPGKLIKTFVNTDDKIVRSNDDLKYVINDLGIIDISRIKRKRRHSLKMSPNTKKSGFKKTIQAIMNLPFRKIKSAYKKAVNERR